MQGKMPIFPNTYSGASGKLETPFVVDDISNTFQPVIGPPDKRVLLLTNIKLPLEKVATPSGE